jgi:hypothetical protein
MENYSSAADGRRIGGLRGCRPADFQDRLQSGEFKRNLFSKDGGSDHVGLPRINREDMNASGSFSATGVGAVLEPSCDWVDKLS